MVLRHHHPETEQVDFVLRPNCSLGWTGMKCAFTVVALATLLITLYFCAIGAWMVLPFAGLELLVVGGAFCVAARDARHQEVISVREDAVVVQWGTRQPEGEQRFQRGWARVELHQPPGWHPSRLYLRIHRRAVRVGAALLEGERRWLARELRRLLEPPSVYARREPAAPPANGARGLCL